ncbi:hypothetical protein BH11PSE12_BH11PSE12_18510 [soil metagenome]
MKYLLAALSLFLSAGVSAEMYKCTVDGKTAYSDIPCVGQGGAMQLKVVPPSAALSPANAAAVTADQNRKQENDKIRNEVDTRIRNRMLSEEIERAETQLRQLNISMEGELETLRRSKGGSGNALVGATRDSGISGEMNAVTGKYANKIAIQKTEIERLHRERDTLNRR